MIQFVTMSNNSLNRTRNKLAFTIHVNCSPVNSGVGVVTDARRGTNIMKIFRLLLLLWLPLTSSAQNVSPPAPDLIIIDYKLGPFMRIDASRSEPAPRGGTPSSPLTEAQSSVTPAFDIDPPRYETKLKPEIKVRHTGARIIKSVDCEFLLTTRGPTTEIRGLTIRFSKVLRPGDTVKFSKLLKADHLGMWRQRQKEGSMSVGASITRIEYGDGLVWERGPLRLQFRN